MYRTLGRRLLRWAATAVALLALVVMTAWLATYFFLGSTPGQRALAALVTDATTMTPSLVRWGPAPDRVIIAGGEVTTADRELVALVAASLDVGLWSALGGDLRIERLRVELARVAANIGPDGQVDILMVLAPPRPRPQKTEPAEAAPRRPRIAIERFEVTIDELTVTSRSVEGLSLKSVAVVGRLEVADRLALELAARTGPLDVAMDRGRRVWGIDALALDRLAVSGPMGGTLAELVSRVEAQALRAGERILSLSAVAAPGAPVVARVDATLAPWDTAALLPGAGLPLGLEVQGLVIELPEVGRGASTVLGRLDHLYAPLLELGPITLDHVSGVIPRVRVEPDRLLPAVDVVVGQLAAARLRGLGWNLEGIYLGAGGIGFARRLHIGLGPGHIAAWKLGEGEAVPATLALDADLGLTGGPITAQLHGDFGLIEAIGKLRFSPLTGRTSFGADVAFADLTGAPREGVLMDLPDDHPLAAENAPPASGRVLFEVEAAAPDGDREPVLTFDEGQVTWPGGGTWRWDGYDWAADGDAGQPGAMP